MAVALHDISFALDPAGVVAAFPYCFGAPMTGVELADVVASIFLHRTSNRADRRPPGQQVNVVVPQTYACSL